MGRLLSRTGGLWLGTLEPFEALVNLRRLINGESSAPLRNPDKSYKHIERSILAVDRHLDKIMRLLLDRLLNLLC